MDKDYLVSVYIPTYFHEQYVAQAIESVLSQKTNFNVEIVIVDDASKDNTPNILKEYANNYENIKVILNESNIGLSENMLLGKKSCNGKYIICLAGDDYWIDENKLQKQVDFLESHPEYLSVATRIEARADNETTALIVLPKKKICNKKFTKKMFLKGTNLPLNGLLVKNVLKDENTRELFETMPKISKYIDDVTDNLYLLMCGDSYILDDVTVAYRTRVKLKSDNNFNSLNKGLVFFEKHIDLLNNLDEYLKGKEDLFVRYRMVVLSGWWVAMKSKQMKRFKEKYNTIPLRYRKRHLMLSCYLHIPAKVWEIISR